MDRRPDVADEVLHAVRGVSLLEAPLDGVPIARRARAAERQQAQAQPLLEEGLLDLVVAPGLALLDDDLLAEGLVPRLLLDDLLHHFAIGHERALLVFAELPESAAVEEELGHGQLDPALGEGHRLAGQPLAHLGLDLLAREPPVHLRDGVVVLGFLADVPDHELHPLVRHEAQAVAEHVRGGQLAVGLALHELDEHRASLFGHVVNEGHFAGHRPPLRWGWSVARLARRSLREPTCEKLTIIWCRSLTCDLLAAAHPSHARCSRSVASRSNPSSRRARWRELVSLALLQDVARDDE